MSDIFVTEIDGQKLTRTSKHEYVAAVVTLDKSGNWGIYSCHETWQAAEKAERQAISWMEQGAYKAVALKGLYKEQQ